MPCGAFFGKGACSRTSSRVSVSERSRRFRNKRTVALFLRNRMKRKRIAATEGVMSFDCFFSLKKKKRTRKRRERCLFFRFFRKGKVSCRNSFGGRLFLIFHYCFNERLIEQRSLRKVTHRLHEPMFVYIRIHLSCKKHFLQCGSPVSSCLSSVALSTLEET